MFLENLEGRQLLAAFTPGNLAVYRVGDGATQLAGTGNPVFIDEYTPAGTLVQSIAMPSSGNGVKLIAGGTTTSEGLLTLSPDGTRLALTGYNTAPLPTAPLASTTSSVVQRSVAVVDPAGSASLYSFSSAFASSSSPRSAIIDGDKLYMSGGGSVHYASAGAMTPGSTGNSSTSLYNLSFGPARSLGIADKQLYSSFTGGNFPIGKVGTGLPTTGNQSMGTLPGLVSGGSAGQFFFADLSPTIGVDSTSATLGSDTLYIADEGSPALRKYSYSGTTWVSMGTIGVDTDDYRGLTGVVNNGTVTLYATRKGGANDTSAQGGGELVSVVDASGYNGAFSGTPTLLASAVTGGRNNTAFRGVAVVPSYALPAPTLASVAINKHIAFAKIDQRSQVVKVTVSFSGAVTLDDGAFTLENIGLYTASSNVIPSNQLLIAPVAGDPASFEISFGSGAGVITRTGPAGSSRGNSLADGNYVLTINPAKVHQADGQTLTGNNKFGADSAGNYKPADKFFRMFGDSDGDGDVDGTDTVAFRRAILNYDASLDWDGGGAVIFNSTDPNSDSNKFAANSSKKRRTV